MLINNLNSKLINSGYHILIMLGLSATAITLGITPEINLQSRNIINVANQAVAQSPTDIELQKYADAAMEIETLRKTTFNNIANIIGKSKPNQLNCYQEETLNQLPTNARSIAISYCEQSETIVKKHGLTINQFNQITQQVKQNPALKQKLQTMIAN